jgi:tungstate transport system ATP-binding protein
MSPPPGRPKEGSLPLGGTARSAKGAPVSALDGDELLRLRRASVSFDGVAALRDVTLTIRRGEAVALVGANGSGKTTLLRLLHGLVDHAGSREVVEPAVQAMVFQRPFMLHLSVLANLRLALWLGGDRKAAAGRPRRALEALERVGLAPLQDRPARVLSGGEQQRLALARAWAVRPQILFLDEPTANLDPSAKREVEALLAGFAAEGMTLVMSTHNLGQAKRLAKRVVYVDGGAIRLDLPTALFFAEAEGRTELFLKGELPWASM